MRIKSDFRSPRVYIVLIIALSWTWKKCWCIHSEAEGFIISTLSRTVLAEQKEANHYWGRGVRENIHHGWDMWKEPWSFQRKLAEWPYSQLFWLLFCLQRATSLSMPHAWGLPSQAHCSVSMVFCTCFIHQLSDPCPVLCVSDLTILVPR